MPWERGVDVVKLLSAPRRDFLVRGNGDQVPLSELKGKLVGLYFYVSHGRSTNDILYLKDRYVTLWRLGKPFEIVLINACIPSNESNQSFITEFRGFPWLAVPLSDTMTWKKMWSELKSSELLPNHLVIIQPDGKPYDIYGLRILRYGHQFYPFTRETFVEREVARLKSLTLDSVLFSGDNKFVIDKQGHKIGTSYLVGKNILLFLTTSTYDPCPLLNKVRAWYNAIKKQDESFEMIHVSLYDYTQHQERIGETFPVIGPALVGSTSDPVGDRISRKIPGLKFIYDDVYNETLFDNLLSRNSKPMKSCRTKHPIFVAFGRDGRFITRTNLYNLVCDERGEPNFEVVCCEDTPNFFDDGNLFREIDVDLAYHHEWPLAIQS